MSHEFKKHDYKRSPLFLTTKTFIESLDELMKKAKSKTISATKNELSEIKHLHDVCSTFQNKHLPMFSQGKIPSVSQLKELKEFMKTKLGQLTPKNQIKTPMDYEIAKLLANFMGTLNNKKLIEIAPFFDMEKFLSTEIPDSALAFLLSQKKPITEILKEADLGDFLTRSQIETHISNKYVELTTALQEYESKNFATPSTTVVEVNHHTLTSEALTIVPTPAIHDVVANTVKAETVETFAQKPVDQEAPRTRVNTLINTLSDKCDAIQNIGETENNEALIQSTEEFQQHLHRFKKRFNRSQLTHDDSAQFADKMSKSLKDMKMHSESGPRSNILSSLISTMTNLFIKLLLNLAECLFNSIFNLSKNPNGFFKPTDTENLEAAPTPSTHQ